MSKLAHLAQIVIILQYKKFVTALELSQVLEVDRKTIYRYIDTLIEAKVPIQTRKGRNGGFYLDDSIFMKEMKLSIEELQALLMASEVLTEKNGFLFEHQLKSAVTKIKNCSIEQLDSEVVFSNIEGHVPFNIKTIGLLEKMNSKINKINNSIENGRAVKADYYSINKQSLTSVTVDPYALIFREADWYLIGFEHQSNCIKAYALSRVKKIMTTEFFFIKPASFKLDQFIENSLSVFYGDKIEVIIKFAKEASSIICDVKWHCRQVIEELEDESILVKLYLDDFNDIKKWIIGFGKAAEVLEPLQLREEIKQNIRELQSIYED
jgi:predicted DNA-binding transcriptional regulator YafY